MNDEIAFILPLLVIFVALLGLGWYVLFMSSRQIRFSFSILAILAGVASVLEFFIFISTDIQQALVFNAIQYIPNVVLPTLTFIFVLRYLHRDDLITPLNVTLLHIIPAIVLLMVWTDPLHHMYYQEVWLGSIGELHTIGSTWGPFSPLHVGYNIILMIGSILLLIRFSLRSHGELAENAKLVALALSLPLILGAASLSMGWSGVTIYSESIGYLIAVVIIFWEVFRLEVMDITPLIHSMLIDDINDAAIIIDDRACIRVMNRAAGTILGVDSEAMVGNMMSARLLGIPEETLDRILGRGEGHLNITLLAAEGDKYFDVSVTYLRDARGDELGRMFIMVDNTERETMIDALKAANIKLNLMSTVTRHDILNQITVVGGYAEMLRNASDDKRDRYMDKIVESSRNIRQLIAFTQVYQDIGVRDPEWVDVAALFRECAQQSIYEVGTSIEIEGVDVLADMLIRNVFLNLLDNTDRHGDGASRIDVTWDVDEGNLIIIYEDDGIGIPASYKERIFDPDFGQNTGIGLFASREILSLTGMTIKEVSEPGVGARFEISVPNGRWRMASEQAL